MCSWRCIASLAHVCHALAHEATPPRGTQAQAHGHAAPCAPSHLTHPYMHMYCLTYCGGIRYGTCSSPCPHAHMLPSLCSATPTLHVEWWARPASHPHAECKTGDAAPTPPLSAQPSLACSHHQRHSLIPHWQRPCDLQPTHPLSPPPLPPSHLTWAMSTMTYAPTLSAISRKRL